MKVGFWMVTLLQVKEPGVPEHSTANPSHFCKIVHWEDCPELQAHIHTRKKLQPPLSAI